MARLKVRFPRFKKRVIYAGMAVGILIIIAVAVMFHLLPSPASLGHLFEPRTTAETISPLADAADPLAVTMNRPLVADFSYGPEEDFTPLSIRFLDQSQGEPTSWNWNFGDNSTSTLQYPSHQYTQTGLYNVTLTVTRTDGSLRSITRDDVLSARRPPAQQVLLDTLRQAILKKGATVTFQAGSDDSSIMINGASQVLPNGSVVKIRTNADSSGNMTIREGRLLRFAFPDVTVYVNGTQVAQGESGDCNLPGDRYFHANLTLSVMPIKGEIRQLLIDSANVMAGEQNSRILVIHDAPNNNGDLTLVTYPAYYEGLVTAIDFTPDVIADFAPASLDEGDAPFNVSFHDLSAGSPDTWSWDFGDGTHSSEENPTHLYASPGSYSVTLTVSRGGQTDMVARQNLIVVTPLRVVANFTASPLEGHLPLEVRFTDRSTGSPQIWNWSFGDGNTSSEQNPVYIYNNTGTYTVWLSAANVYGSSDLVRPHYVTVTNPFLYPDAIIILRTGKQGYVVQGSCIQFTIRNTPATIAVNGSYYDLPKGSLVSIEANSNQTGEIYINNGQLLKFSFPDMSLYIDGNLTAAGPVESIYVPYMDDFQTALTYYLEPNSAWTLVSVNGYTVLNDLDNSWIQVSALGMNAQGNLRLISTDNSTYIDGAANQTMTVQDWIIQ
jgi:PKD repeat protein